MIADGIRAGNLEPLMGNAEIIDVGYTTLDATTLEEISKAPNTFTFKCDVIIKKKF